MLEQSLREVIGPPAGTSGSAAAAGALKTAGSPLRILIAPDKFKGCLTAADVAGALRAGIASGAVGPKPQVTLLPLADGGDGSVEAALSAGFRLVAILVQGADGLVRSAGIAFDGTTAVVEVAGTCGLATLRGQLRPLDASSRGIGEAMLTAALLKPKRLVVALGGSASTDGGAGMLAALGAQFKDADGDLVEPNGGELERIADVDLSNVFDFTGIELVGASDVTNPLRGHEGAAHVFGPQKGADAATVARLDAGLSALIRACRGVPSLDPERLADRPGAGSAGGIGFGLLLLGGSLVSGADYFLDLLGFDGHVQKSDLLITGEGRLDAQTADGKLISAVCARAAGTPVRAVVGSSALDEAAAQELGLEDVIALQDLSALDTSKDPVAATTLLQQAGRNVIDAFSARQPAG
ncbi:glycerate kinase [Arthrobacter sp. D1-17]